MSMMINAIIENGTHADIVEYVAKQESDTKRAQANEDHYRNLVRDEKIIKVEMKRQLTMATFLATLTTEKDKKMFADCCGMYLTRSHINAFVHNVIARADMYIDYISDYHEKKREEEKEKIAKMNNNRKRPRPYQEMHQPVHY